MTASHTDVGPSQCGSIVDSVPRHCHHPASPPAALHDAQLLSRRSPCKDNLLVVEQHRVQLIISHLLRACIHVCVTCVCVYNMHPMFNWRACQVLSQHWNNIWLTFKSPPCTTMAFALLKKWNSSEWVNHITLMLQTLIWLPHSHFMRCNTFSFSNLINSRVTCSVHHSIYSKRISDCDIITKTEHMQPTYFSGIYIRHALDSPVLKYSYVCTSEYCLHSRGLMIPTIFAMALAVMGWSPVTMITWKPSQQSMNVNASDLTAYIL